MVSVWIALLIAAISGIASAIVTPFVTSWLQLKNWRRQRRFELKYQAFREAIDALGKLVTDALDFGLQANKRAYKGVVQGIELRPQTREVLEAARSLVQVFFSRAAVEAYTQALGAKISLDNIPFVEFEEARRSALKLMATELGISQE